MSKYFKVIKALKPAKNLAERRKSLDEMIDTVKAQYKKSGVKDLVEIEDSLRELTKLESDFATQRAQARETLIKKIDPILNVYIKENNISLIIDKNYTLGGSSANDITEVVIERLNKELPSLNLK